MKVQAAKSLAELALDVFPASIRRCLAVDVRDRWGNPVPTTELTFEVRSILAEAEKKGRAGENGRVVREDNQT